MTGLYLYNKGSHTLHIKNLCKDARGSGLIPYDSENDALRFEGRSLGMCKVCMENAIRF